MKTSPVTLSLIIPAFNEEHRIGPSLEQIFRFCNAQPYAYEVIIVDDGSTDNTFALIRNSFGSHPQINILRRAARSGKGAAVQQGMLQSRGEYIFFCDADLAVPIATVSPFIDQLKNGCDIAIGTRLAPASKIELHQPKFREALGRIFIWLSNLLLGLDHSDITCGFKGFRRDVARQLCAQQRVHNWSFDAEILFLARLKGYRVAEIPVSWRNGRGSKVRLWKDAAASFLGLLKIRANHIVGKYR